MFRQDNVSDEFCGIASISDGRDGDFAYSYYKLQAINITGIDCQNSVLVHEVGHVMGLKHSARQDPEGGTFRWSRGYGIDQRFVTIMAYSSEFMDAPDIDLFSSPELSCNGYPCGIDKSDYSDGADSVLSLNTTRFQVAAFMGGDADNDGVTDSDDAFPNDATESVDTDGDGIGNNADTDDDGDGVWDFADAFPLDPSEWVDTDGDGTGDNSDTDADNDGVLDVDDAFPWNALESVDTDGDGTGDWADLDDDNDGVFDSQDAFPFDASESLDTDNDGIGNNADVDDDNDGILDVDDTYPLDSTNTPLSRLKNLATRGFVGTGDNVLIGGLIISGTEPKTVVIRARGPALAEAGVTGALSDPQITLFSGATVIDSNDDWQDHANIQMIPTDLKPTDSREAVIATTLNPGAYTAIVSGFNGEEGIGLIEIFEVEDTGLTRLVNIATRGFIGTGDNIDWRGNHYGYGAEESGDSSQGT